MQIAAHIWNCKYRVRSTLNVVYVQHNGIHTHIQYIIHLSCDQKTVLPHLLQSFLNGHLFLSVVGVLCQEAVHEQKSVCSWTVKNTGPTVSIKHLQDGWIIVWMRWENIL